LLGRETHFLVAILPVLFLASFAAVAHHDAAGALPESLIISFAVCTLGALVFLLLL
jgi:hypothetical protein